MDRVPDQLSHRQRQLPDQRRYRKYLFFRRQLRALLEVDDVDIAAVPEMRIADIPQVIDRITGCRRIALDI